MVPKRKATKTVIPERPKAVIPERPVTVIPERPERPDNKGGPKAEARVGEADLETQRFTEARERAPAPRPKEVIQRRDEEQARPDGAADSESKAVDPRAGQDEQPEIERHARLPEEISTETTAEFHGSKEDRERWERVIEADRLGREEALAEVTVKDKILPDTKGRLGEREQTVVTENETGNPREDLAQRKHGVRLKGEPEPLPEPEADQTSEGEAHVINQPDSPEWSKRTRPPGKDVVEPTTL